MVRQHEAGRRMDEADIRKMLSQLIDIVVHCWENNGTFGISQVRFLAAEAQMDAAA